MFFVSNLKVSDHSLVLAQAMNKRMATCEGTYAEFDQAMTELETSVVEDVQDYFCSLAD